MSESAPLGYANSRSIGWNGEMGSIPIIGPVEQPCQDCGKPRRQHSSGPYGLGCKLFNPAPQPAKPHEIVQCEVLTSWTCWSCGKDNDVSGEGAAYSWMECGYCPEYSWLVMS
jgi:hypothetical protein